MPDNTSADPAKTPHAEEFEQLERELQEAEAQQAAKHPPHETWSPMVGQDVDGDDEPEG